MKKMNLYLWLIALVGLTAACSNDNTADALQTNESNRVSLTASLPADFATIGTRALPSAPDGYKLRCILEVWTQGDNSVLKHREEKAGLSGENVQFNFTIDEGIYDCLFWADYIESNVTATDATISSLPFQHYPDKHYKTNDETNGLKAIEIIIKNTTYAFNTDARDAFFGSYELRKEAAAVENPSIPALTRPFAKLTIKEKDATNYSACTGLEARYYVPYRFNVQTGAVNNESTKLVQCTNKLTENQELFFDYIFTDASSTLGNIAMEFTGSKTFQDITIPAGIPLQRNYKTIASGTLITEQPVSTNDVKLTVTMDNAWNGSDVEVDLDARIWDGTTKTQPAGYDATTPGIVDITSAAELAWLSSQNISFEGYTFNLTTDINLNNHEWTPIGANEAFKGTFDGKNHTVSNLKCTNSLYAGLFGRLNGATVKDVTVNGSVSYNMVENNCFLGGIAGYVNDSSISGCTNRCTITATGTNTARVGGIVGYVNTYNSDCTLSNNTNFGTATTSDNDSSTAGGIIGYASAGVSLYTITLTSNTYSSGTPSDVCIGECFIAYNASIIVDNDQATSREPYPVPTSR